MKKAICSVLTWDKGRKQGKMEGRKEKRKKGKEGGKREGVEREEGRNKTKSLKILLKVSEMY